MDETAAAFDTEDPGHEEPAAPISSRRLLRRPTLAETEQIARLSTHDLSDAFAANILRPKRPTVS
jgi:hypothetical protein